WNFDGMDAARPGKQVPAGRFGGEAGGRANRDGGDAEVAVAAVAHGDTQFAVAQRQRLDRAALLRGGGGGQEDRQRETDGEAHARSRGARAFPGVGQLVEVQAIAALGRAGGRLQPDAHQALFARRHAHYAREIDQLVAVLVDVGARGVLRPLHEAQLHAQRPNVVVADGDSRRARTALEV